MIIQLCRTAIPIGLYGVAAHDVYHTGQIQLIKRLGGFL